MGKLGASYLSNLNGIKKLALIVCVCILGLITLAGVASATLTEIWSGDDFSTWTEALCSIDENNIVMPVTSLGTHGITYPYSLVDGEPYVLQVNVSRYNATYIALSRGGGSDAFTARYAIFNLATGTVARSPSGANSASIMDMGDGVYMCTYKIDDPNGGGTSFSIFDAANAGGTSSEVTYAGTANWRFKIHNASIYTETDELPIIDTVFLEKDNNVLFVDWDNDTASVVVDESYYKNNGTVSGADRKQAFTSYRVFNPGENTTDYVKIPSSASIDNANNRALEIKFSMPAMDEGERCTLLSKINSTAGYNLSIIRSGITYYVEYCTFYTDGLQSWRIYYPENNTLYSVPVGEQVNILISHDATHPTNTLSYYPRTEINGAYYYTQNIGAWREGTLANDAGLNLTIGNNDDNTAPGTVNVSFFALWNTTITERPREQRYQAWRDGVLNVISNIPELQDIIDDDVIAGQKTVLTHGEYYGNRSSSYITVPEGAIIDCSGSNFYNIAFKISNVDNVSITGARFINNNFTVINSSIDVWGGCKNITLNDIITDGSRTGAPVLALVPGPMQYVYIKNCYFNDSDNYPIEIFNVSSTSAHIDNVLIENVTAIYNGYYGRAHDWVVGFDLAEQAGVPLYVNNLTVINCTAAYSWESGFHIENGMVTTNISFTNCISKHNADIKLNPLFGDGFFLGAANIYNCTTESVKNTAIDFRTLATASTGANVSYCDLSTMDYGIASRVDGEHKINLYIDTIKISGGVAGHQYSDQYDRFNFIYMVANITNDTGNPVQFYSSHNYPEPPSSDTLTYQWEWGDGTANGTDKDPSHEYAASGTYQINLTIENTFTANTTTTTKTFTVDGTDGDAPTANFTAMPTSGVGPLQVVFNGSISTGNITYYLWNFDDSTGYAVMNGTPPGTIPHTYDTPGTYAVELTVGNDDGENTTSIIITVIALTYPTAGFTRNVTTGYAPLTVGFTDASMNATSWQYDFTNDGVNDSTAQNPVYTYNAPGTYSVRQYAINENGTTTLLRTNYITVLSVPVAAGFSADDTTITTGTTVTFTSSSVNATAWSWNFGTGEGTSTNENPTHQYNAPGSFTVTLTATNAYGGSDVETKTSYITVTLVPPTITDFTGTPTSGQAPLSTSWSATTTGICTSWLWNFGDNHTGVGANPSHLYAIGGNFTVSLTITGPGGSDTMTKTSYVNLNPRADQRPTVPPSATIALHSTSFYDQFIQSIFGNGSMDNVSPEGAADAVLDPYTENLGPMAIIMILGSLALVLYIKTESVVLPGIITVADGALFMWMMPYDWQFIGYGVIIIGFVAIAWGILVKRGS